MTIAAINGGLALYERPVVLLHLAAIAALLLTATSPRPASSSAAPAAPTFVLAWGTFGAAPGQLNRPYGLATDALGNVYVADRLNNRVQKFDPLGNFITQWGTLGTGNGQLNGPFGVAVDAAGHVYVAERFGNRIQKFDGNGIYIAQWGTAGAGNGQFNQPLGVAVAGGYVYVMDFGNNRVQKFDSAGNYIAQWGSAGSGNGQFNFAVALGTDIAGNVYVVDANNSRIQKFDSDGNFLTKWGSPGSGNGQFNNLGAVTTDAVGNVYVVDNFNSRVQKFTKDGTYLAQWGSLGDGNGQFRYDVVPAGIAVDAAGNVYVSNWTNDNLVHRIQKFSGAGVALSQAAPSYLLQWGTAGSGNGQFSGPVDVAVDAAGSLYVADALNNRIQKFSSTGAYVTQWGTAGSGDGQLSNPVGIAADAAGNLYVPDYFNHRVQKFTGGGGYITQWGTVGSGNGQFSGPSDVTADAAGNVYVVDNGNNRIQKFTNAGAYITQWGSLGSGNGQFSAPTDMAADAAGNVYVVDSGNSRIEKFTSAGAYITQWGSAGPGNGQFTSPYGVATDAAGNVYVTDFYAHRVQEFTGDGAYLAQWGSFGGGTGQFNNPTGIVADAAGNVYVADFGNNRVQKFVAPPRIALVSDVGNDAGGQARLRILRSSADSPSSGATITGYGIYRRIDPYPGAAGTLPVAGETSAGMPVAPPGALLAGWEQVGTISARGDVEYEAVVPTLYNSTASSVFYTALLVRALTPDLLTYYDSAAEYGYSIDNPPPVPAPFTAAYVGGGTHLHWGASPSSDFATFRLYRGAGAGFVPAPGNLVMATADTFYVDPGPAGNYYKLSAVDLNGNESVYASVRPSQTTAVSANPPLAFALEALRPNPASGHELAAHFVLPVAAAAELDLIDVAGRRVEEQEVGWMGPGAHAVDLGAGMRIRPGLYFVRLRQGASEQVRRVTVLEP